MKTQVFKRAIEMAAIMAFCVTIISCDKKELSIIDEDMEEESLSECYVDKNDLFFESRRDDVRELSITCRGSWEIANLPEWLSTESTQGYGKAVVRLATRTANESSSARQEIIQVRFADNPKATRNVQVEQRGCAVADCEVRPDLIVTLANGIAFDCSFEKNVAHYYRGYLEASSVGIMSDEEIIVTLKDNFKRYTPTQDEVADFDGLRSGTRYVIYTLGYDKYGNRGDLVSTEVTTGTTRGNDPKAIIENMGKSGGNWYWTVNTTAACRGYYMMNTEDPDFAYASDVLQAWCLEYAARNGRISEYANGANWKQTAGGPLLAVWTRGMDAHGNLSSVIEWGCISPSSMRNAPARKGHGPGDHSVNKPSPDQFSLYRVD